MIRMFHGASSFDQNIGNWNVASVRNMKDMFDNAQAFDQNIGNWNVASVTNMQGMFYGASSFNQDVSDWSVSVSATTTNMFQGATAFNDDREITATIATTQSVFTDAEIDLEISVMAGACGSSETSECNLLTTTNGRAVKGLYCDVKISPTTNSACASSDFSENLLPCSSWPNFIDESKATVYQKTLTTTDLDGNLVTGVYTLEYTCGWKFETGVTFPGISTSNSDFTFTVAADCSEWAQSDDKRRLHADTFLLSAPAFIEMSLETCGNPVNFDAIKEALFREYDEDMSGSLSYDELFNALTHTTRHFAPSTIKSSYSEILLSHVMSSNTLPLKCQDEDDFTNIKFTNIHYPNSDSDTQIVCEDGSTSCLHAYRMRRREGDTHR